MLTRASDQKITKDIEELVKDGLLPTYFDINKTFSGKGDEGETTFLHLATKAGRNVIVDCLVCLIGFLVPHLPPMNYPRCTFFTSHLCFVFCAHVPDYS